MNRALYSAAVAFIGTCLFTALYLNDGSLPSVAQAPSLKGFTSKEGPSFTWLPEDTQSTIMGYKEHHAAMVEAVEKNPGTVFLGGVLDDGAKISTEAIIFLVQLSCMFQVESHVLLVKNAQPFEELVALMQLQFPFQKCAPIHVEEQPAAINAIPSRIDRLRQVRDYQRERLASLLEIDLEETVVVLTDMDLGEFPLPSRVVEHALQISDNRGAEDIDILCAGGVVKNFEHEQEAYYDTFATVLYPDTFVYPLPGRMIQEVAPNEDASLILSKNFTNVDLLAFLKEQGSNDEYKANPHDFRVTMDPVPARSCFGGLAMYRASKYLDQHCSYTSSFHEGMMRYANKDDERPCEHVEFHSCLLEHNQDIKIGIQPDLRTRWMKSDGKNHRAHAKSYAISKFGFVDENGGLPVEVPVSGEITSMATDAIDQVHDMDAIDSIASTERALYKDVSGKNADAPGRVSSKRLRILAKEASDEAEMALHRELGSVARKLAVEADAESMLHRELSLRNLAAEADAESVAHRDLSWVDRKLAVEADAESMLHRELSLRNLAAEADAESVAHRDLSWVERRLAAEADAESMLHRELSLRNLAEEADAESVAHRDLSWVDRKLAVEADAESMLHRELSLRNLAEEANAEFVAHRDLSWVDRRLAAEADAESMLHRGLSLRNLAEEANAEFVAHRDLSWVERRLAAEADAESMLHRELSVGRMLAEEATAERELIGHEAAMMAAAMSMIGRRDLAKEASDEAEMALHRELDSMRRTLSEEADAESMLHRELSVGRMLAEEATAERELIGHEAAMMAAAMSMIGRRDLAKEASDEAEMALHRELDSMRRTLSEEADAESMLHRELSVGRMLAEEATAERELIGHEAAMMAAAMSKIGRRDLAKEASDEAEMALHRELDSMRRTLSEEADAESMLHRELSVGRMLAEEATAERELIGHEAAMMAAAMSMMGRRALAKEASDEAEMALHRELDPCSMRRTLSEVEADEAIVRELWSSSRNLRAADEAELAMERELWSSSRNLREVDEAELAMERELASSTRRKLSENAADEAELAMERELEWSARKLSEHAVDEEESAHRRRLVTNLAKEVATKVAGDSASLSSSSASLAWLMSFPNSGTSYTMDLIHILTGKAMATNYAAESRDAMEESGNGKEEVPVYASSKQGPFWLQGDRHYNSGEVVLTKTHCGGYGVGSNPLRTREIFRSQFIESCSRDDKFQDETYSTENIRKAVHLIRDPFDNVVSRFHHEVNLGRSSITGEQDRFAFLDFCATQSEIKHEQQLLEMQLLAEDYDILQFIPCASDFYRYVMWHNKAFEAVKELGIDSHVLHYESYSSDFEGTQKELLDFLGMKQVAEAPTFKTGKAYWHFYSKKQRKALAGVFSRLASAETWAHIEKYFD